MHNALETYKCVRLWQWDVLCVQITFAECIDIVPHRHLESIVFHFSPGRLHKARIQNVTMAHMEDYSLN